MKGVKILIELMKGFHPTVAPALTALNQFPSLVNEVNHIESILSKSFKAKDTGVILLIVDIKKLL